MMVIVSWDGNNINDGTNYESGFNPGMEWGLPTVRATQVPRLKRWPRVSGVERPGRKLYVNIRIVGSSVATLRDQLVRWLDPEDEDPKKLIISDVGGGNQRYVYAVCEALQPITVGQMATEKAFVITLAVHGDVRWRATSTSSDVWNITATGQTNVISNGGTDDAYPVYTITPTSGLTGGYDYKRFVIVRWRTSLGWTNYPTDIGDDSFDTQTLVGAGKMQADGDDLRVKVDGVEVDRWLDGINTTTTKVWVNLDWEGAQEATLEDAIAGSGAVDTIDVNESIDYFPSTGILLIDSELFIYTGKNNSLRRFTGCTRAAKGTSMAAHTASTAVYWIQHDIWIYYGNSAVSAPSVDNDYQPIFSLATSTNTSWDYDNFGEDDGLRTGAWAFWTWYSTGYTDNRTADADPWTEVGLTHDQTRAIGMVGLNNPCGITNANFQNGEQRVYDRTSSYSYRIVSWTLIGGYGDVEYTIPAPSADDTWESWSRNETLTTGAIGVWLDSQNTDGTATPNCEHNNLEVADVTLTLNSSYTPAITIGSEQGSYELDCTITNTTTGDAISVSFTIATNEDLEIDTYNKTVTYKEDDSSQFQALTIVGSPRKDWLKLQPGNNTLQWTETGCNGVTLTTEFEARRY